MSGPKIDHAELQRRQREALERARLERLNQIKMATGAFHKANQGAFALADAIKGDRLDIISRFESKPEMAVTIQNINSIKTEYRNRITNLKNVSIPVEPNDIFTCARGIETKASSLKSEYEVKSLPEFKRINAFAKAEDKQKSLENFSASMSGATAVKVMNFVDFEFATESISKSENISSDIKTLVQETLEDIYGLINSDWISQKDKRAAIALAKKIIAATQQNEASTKRAIDELNMAKPGISRRIADFEDLYGEYTAEYVLYLGELNKMRKHKLSIKPKSKNKFTSIEKLDNEIAMIRKYSQKANEDNYIREQIGEVMQMFGYDLCEDIVLSAEQMGSHYVCPDKNGKNAIHIHISDSKQLMMEIVGFENRKAPKEAGVSAIIENVPGTNESLANRLLNEQGKFCSIHPKITEELSKRGINLTEKAHRKPDLKYCKKIINLVSDDSICSAITDENDLINTNYSERKLVRKKAERAIKL